jgi:hypothetical protein
VSLIVGAISMTACSESPVSPVNARDIEAGTVAARQTAVAGLYQLSFLDHSLQPVTSLPVGGPELILKAHVTDLFGIPATSGTVEFQYCSLKGLPPNDIDRADETSSADCATSAASWSRLMTLSVDANGNALMNFGFVRIPRTIGFRFKYSGKRSGIAGGVSLPQDFTWTAN